MTISCRHGQDEGSRIRRKRGREGSIWQLAPRVWKGQAKERESGRKKGSPGSKRARLGKMEGRGMQEGRSMYLF